MKFEIVEEYGNNFLKNLIIESENLYALQYLIKEHTGKVDVITIDPPYNTNIDYIEYKDSDFNGGWGNFIEQRLRLAYQLLSPKGVIFINIDENELASLLSISYNIFGKNNVNILIWPKIDSRFDQNRIEKPTINVKSTHEYIILCYKEKHNTIFQNTIDNKPLESIVAGYGTTSSAKDEIYGLLGSRDIFSTPKPIPLIKELIRVSSKQDSIVVDFFAGSGTAGHAVVALNKEDEGKRRFILITNNENNICEKITVPRIKSAMQREQFDSGFTHIRMSSFEEVSK